MTIIFLIKTQSLAKPETFGHGLKSAMNATLAVMTGLFLINSQSLVKRETIGQLLKYKNKLLFVLCKNMSVEVLP